MTEDLKTLKDLTIIIGFDGDKPLYGKSKILEPIRQEAIKWFNYLLSLRECCSLQSDEWGEYAAQMNFIKDFFNLTEDDLKEAST